MTRAAGRLFTRPALIFGVLLAFLGFGAGASRAAWVSLGGSEGTPVAVRVAEEVADRTVLDIRIAGFYADPVVIEGKTYFTITLPGEGRLLEQGLPGLPLLARSLIIPDQARMAVRVLESDVVELDGYPVAPSRGNLLRSADPSTIAYRFASIYAEALWWPAVPVRQGNPYILRDHRGLTVEAFPFHAYGPGGRLRVARRMRVEVYADGLDNRNVPRRAKRSDGEDPAFTELYAKQFLNWHAARTTPASEAGAMLVIAADSLHHAILPFVEWKKQSGIPVRLVDVSVVGNTEAEIDAYIDSAYFADGLAYVLLVGDAEQVAPAYAAGGASDPTYALVEGDDSYPEVFIGRFSAATAAELTTQVDRTIDYERSPEAGAGWYHAGTGIASDEGPGDNGEYDFEHVEIIRGKLLGSTYTQVDQIYDPGATAAMVATALNAGRSIVNYTGHGSSIGWSTSGFTDADVTALTNDRMLPFIFSVGCVSGAFAGATCFAETWLRAQHDGVPTGAIAAYMSSVNQTWDPPMSAQDAFVDLLIGGQMQTIGGLCTNGSCRMMDVYGTAGANMFRTWILFGDPSLRVRTAEPQAMSVLHPDSLFVGETVFPVTVAGVPGARCALYADGALYGAAETDAGGSAVIEIAAPPQTPMTLLLTVTASNTIPHIAPIAVLPLSGPTLVLSGVRIADGQTGDGDGVAGAGETITLSIALRNSGIAPADSVSAVIATADPFAEFDLALQPFGRIDPDSSVLSAGPYVIVLRGDTPDQHVVPLTLAIHSAQKSWTRSFNLTVSAPVLVAGSALVDDTAWPGDGDGTADPGETFLAQLRFSNQGHGGARGLQGVLSCSDPEVRILQDSGECLFAPAGGAGIAGPFRVQVSASCPTPKTLPFHLSLRGKGGVAAELDFPVQLGDWFDDAEIDRGWTLGLADDTATSGQWVRGDPVGTAVDGQPAQPEDDHTPPLPAVNCFVTGNGAVGGAAEEADVDGGRTTLLSPVFHLEGATSATLDYWRWYSNRLIGGADLQDNWTVEVTSDGVEWVPLEHTTAGATQWRHITRALEEYIALTNQVRVRFTVDDLGSESLVEAALDDLKLVVLRSPPTAVPATGDASGGAFFSLSPNPLVGSGRVVVRSAGNGPVKLALYDVAGRVVRSIFEGRATGRELTVRFDAAGIPAGAYYLRLDGPGVIQSKRVTILR